MDNLLKITLFTILAFKAGILIYSIIKFTTFSTALKVVFYLLVCSFFSDLISFIATQNKVDSIIIVNSYTLIEGILYMFLFNQLEEKWAIPWSIIIFLVVGLFEWIIFSKNSRFLDVSNVFESSLLILFSLRFFLRTLGELKVGRLRNYPYFWINCGILFYFAGSLFLFAFGNLIVSYSIMFLWNLHNFLHIIYLFFISIAFWKVRSAQI
jgi:hypothetical protein